MMTSLASLIAPLTDRLLSPLPGPVAHEPLRALPIGHVKPVFEHRVPPKPGSVLILLYEADGEIRFPLIKRPEYLGAHSGQISLPGGKAEAGEDVIQTALREGQEEIGIEAHTVQVLGRLSEFFVMPSNFLVTPVVGIIPYVPRFLPDAHEVDRIITYRVNDLLRDDAVQTREILAAGKFAMQAPHFEVEGEIVWGATAMMLNEFRAVLREMLL